MSLEKLESPKQQTRPAGCARAGAGLETVYNCSGLSQKAVSSHLTGPEQAILAPMETPGGVPTVTGGLHPDARALHRKGGEPGERSQCHGPAARQQLRKAEGHFTHTPPRRGSQGPRLASTLAEGRWRALTRPPHGRQQRGRRTSDPRGPRGAAHARWRGSSAAAGRRRGRPASGGGGGGVSRPD